MVMIGAYAKVTGVVAVESLVEAMAESIPEYRRQHIADNAEMIRVGFELDSLGTAPFWDAPVGSVR